MIDGVVRFLLLSCLLFNTYYLILLNERITNISLELNMKVEDTDFIGFLKRFANNLDDQIEIQRNRVRESLKKKGIEERNNVLMHAREVRANELNQK